MIHVLVLSRQELGDSRYVGSMVISSSFILNDFIDDSFTEFLALKLLRKLAQTLLYIFVQALGHVGHLLGS